MINLSIDKIIVISSQVTFPTCNVLFLVETCLTKLLHSLYRYALGGFDGVTMVPSVEVFDPRLGKWTVEETTMNHPRGYFAAAVVKDSIYVIGGVNGDENIVDTVSKSIDLSLLPLVIHLVLISHSYSILAYMHTGRELYGRSRMEGNLHIRKCQKVFHISHCLQS